MKKMFVIAVILLGINHMTWSMIMDDASGLKKESRDWHGPWAVVKASCLDCDDNRAAQYCLDDCAACCDFGVDHIIKCCGVVRTTFKPNANNNTNSDKNK